MRGFIKSLTQEKRWTGPAAAVLGFLEASFVVFPMESLFIPMMAARHARAWVVALWLLAGNVPGALLMYGLGALFLEPVIEPLIRFLDLQSEYDKARADLEENGFISLFMVGVTPIPFQVGTAAAGAIKLALPVFMLAVTVSRFIRFMALAMLVMLIGTRSQSFIERHERGIFIAGALVFVAISGWMLWGG